MSLNELFFVAVGGLLGWWIVSWVISLFRQQKRPPVDIVDAGGSWGERPRGRSALSGPESAAQWASILGVAESASAAEVEAAYHARLAECDRVRFEPTTSDAEKEEAQVRRARVTEAYEFVRPLKM